MFYRAPTPRQRLRPVHDPTNPASAAGDAPGRILRPIAQTVLLLLALASGAHAIPLLDVSPTTVGAGDEVQLDMSGFIPGGFDVSITFDGGYEVLYPMPSGGTGSTTFTIPAGALGGTYDIVVCAACGQGDLEQRASRSIQVSAGQIGPGEVDIQIHALEVTQGVRGDIPRRDLLGNTALPNDPTIHVAGRTTVVRVIPMFNLGPGAPYAVQAAAELTVSEGGTVLGTLSGDEMTIGTIRTPQSRRSDAAYTWNFTLPLEWVALDAGTDVRTLDLEARLFMDGETPGYEVNNFAYLDEVTFRKVRGKPNAAFWLRPHFVRLKIEEAPGDTVEYNADYDLLPMIFSNIQDLLPIADGRTGINLRGWRYADWVGPLKDEDGRELFVSAMVRQFLPTGTLSGNPVHDYHGFFFRPGGCSGAGWRETPYFHAGVCPQPRYVTAHEITHAIGQAHAGNGHNEANGGGYDYLYPGEHGQVEENTWGFNVYRGVALAPTTAANDEGVRHDFMSYGPAFAWTSRYTWNSIADRLGSSVEVSPRPSPAIDLAELAGRNADGGPHIITGFIHEYSGEVDVSPLFSAMYFGNPSNDGELRITVTDFFGIPLREQLVPIRRLQDAEEPGDDWRFFATQIDMPSSWYRMKFQRGGGEEVLYRSSNAPGVTLFEPAPGFSWDSGQAYFDWSGEDQDGDALTYRILGARDNGPVSVLASDITDTEYWLDLDTLPGGGTWALIVEVSDGFRTAYSNLTTGTVTPRPPFVGILFPEDGGMYAEGTSIQARGVFGDLQFEDGYEPQQQIQWYLNGGYLGDGDAIDLGELPEGFHEVNAVFFNDHGLSAEAQVTFQVASTLPGPALVSPPDGAGGVPLPAVLEWEPADFLTAYRLQVAADPDFDSIVLEEGGLFETIHAFDALEGSTYYWRVAFQAGGLDSEWSVARSFTTEGAASADELGGTGGRVRNLGVQVVPNPFQPGAHVAFRIPYETRVEVRIYDVTGATVRTLFDGMSHRGAHQIAWDGFDDQGLPVSSGVYFIQVRGAGMEERIRAVKMK